MKWFILKLKMALSAFRKYWYWWLLVAYLYFVSFVGIHLFTGRGIFIGILGILTYGFLICVIVMGLEHLRMGIPSEEDIQDRIEREVLRIREKEIQMRLEERQQQKKSSKTKEQQKQPEETEVKVSKED